MSTVWIIKSMGNSNFWKKTCMEGPARNIELPWIKSNGSQRVKKSICRALSCLEILIS